MGGITWAALLLRACGSLARFLNQSIAGTMREKAENWDIWPLLQKRQWHA